MTVDPVIHLEVAVEALNRECAALESALRAENAKASPSQAIIDFFNAEIRALMDLSDKLFPADVETIEMVIQRFALRRFRSEPSNV